MKRIDPGTLLPSLPQASRGAVMSPEAMPQPPEVLPFQMDLIQVATSVHESAATSVALASVLLARGPPQWMHHL